MAAATSADLSSAVEVVHTAGGTDVSVLQNDVNAPRIEFNLEADDEGQAASAAHRALQHLTEATPLLVGGWILVSIIAA
jgi:hypothetical protein